MRAKRVTGGRAVRAMIQRCPAPRRAGRDSDQRIMEEPMTRAILSLVAAAFLTCGCAGQSPFEDRSSEVKIKHRTEGRN